MPVSPTDFSLWARLTGNKYPSNAEEKARIAPDVHRFIQNMDKQGAVGVSNPKEKENKDSLGTKIAKGALVAGGIAAGIAAARDKRVQDVVQKAASTTKNKIDDFLVNLGRAQDVDVDIVDASGDVTPNPRQQQSSAPYWNTTAGKEELLENEAQSAFMNSPEGRAMAKKEVALRAAGEDYNYLPQIENWKDTYKAQKAAGVMNEEALSRTINLDATGSRQQQSNITPQLTSGPSLIERVEQKKAEIADSFKPAVEGKTFQTSGAVGSEDVYGDIGDAKLRARRTFGPTIDAIKEMNPDQNVSRMGRQMLNQAQRDRDFDISYITARNSGMSDADAVQVARETAGFNPDAPVGKPTEYRNLLGTLKTSSPLKPRIDDLINLVQTGQKIKLPEGVQEPGALVQISANNATPDNKAIKVGAEIGGPTLTDQQATKMAVDNVLDNARDAYEKQVSTIVEAGRTGGGSIKSRAGAEAFLQKAKTDVVRNLDRAIEQDLTQTTGLNPEDAANIAESVINPTTGERQFNTDQFGDLGTETKRNIKDLRSVPNIDPDTKQGTMKTAVGTAIRGRAPSYYEALPKTDTRELPGPFEETVPDRRTATRGGFGAALQKSIEEEGISPAKMPEGGSAGIGIYGEQPGYVSGPFSPTAGTKPTDAPGKTSPFKGVSDSTLTKLKSDMKPGTKSFESVDKEQRGRASMDAARELRKIQTSGDPSTSTERVAKFLDNLKKQQGG